MRDRKNVHVYQFLANRFSKSIKIDHTIFAKNDKLHKFATTNSNFEK